MTPEKWPKIRSVCGDDHRVFSIRRDLAVSPRTGAEHEFVVLESVDWVAVLALTPDEQLLLIRQYRHGLGEVSLEVPGGLVDPGLTPEQAARAELRQETGYGGGRWSKLGELSVVPAVFSNRLHVFLAEGVELQGPPDPDECEDIVLELVPLEAAEELIRSGELIHAQVLAALHLYRMHRE
jgi:8-oxo-dGTP pyrophosphatase MutT (NUDIX family)